MARVFEDSPDLSDLLLRSYDPEYCFEEIAFENDSGDDITLPSGQPMTLAGAAIDAATLAGGGTQTECLNLRRVVVPDGKTVKLLVLRRGPAVLKVAGLPTKDYAGADFNMTAFKAEIATLNPPILLRDPLDEVEEQTT